MYKVASMTRGIYVTRNDFNVNNRNTSAQICSRSEQRSPPRENRTAGIMVHRLASDHHHASRVHIEPGIVVVGRPPVRYDRRDVKV